MAELNPIGFLLNQSSDAKATQVVDAPAFSLTKVLASAAVVVTPLATYIVDKASSLDLTAQQYIVLAIGLLGFLAITASADVLGRSLATAAEKNGLATRAAAAGVVQFPQGIKGQKITDRVDLPVTVLASSHGGGNPQFLISHDGDLSWVGADDVRFA